MGNIIENAECCLERKKQNKIYYRNCLEDDHRFLGMSIEEFNETIQLK